MFFLQNDTKNGYDPFENSRTSVELLGNTYKGGQTQSIRTNKKTTLTSPSKFLMLKSVGLNIFGDGRCNLVSIGASSHRCEVPPQEDEECFCAGGHQRTSKQHFSNGIRSPRRLPGCKCRQCTQQCTEFHTKVLRPWFPTCVFLKNRRSCTLQS